MKFYFKISPIAWLALSVICVFGAYTNQAIAAMQEENDAAQEEEAVPGYTQEEYDAYTAAVNESDFLKRGEMLLQFKDKYPQSELLPYITQGYETLLFDCSAAEEWGALEKLAEKWLELHPDDLQAIAYIAKAAAPLEHYEKLVKTKILFYKLKPSGQLAKEIANTYRWTLNDIPKFLEWTKIIFSYHEYDGDFNMRYDLVRMYLNDDPPKAVEYAQQTLKSISFVKDPSAETEEQIHAIQLHCYDIIGTDLFKQDKWAEAMTYFELALKMKESPEAHYSIANCLYEQAQKLKGEEKEEKYHAAMISFAKAELLGGEIASKAKESLETIYKWLHNDTLIGVEKIYKEAKEQNEINTNKEAKEQNEINTNEVKKEQDKTAQVNP